MKKKDQKLIEKMKENLKKTVDDNIHDMVRGKYFVAKKGFNYCTMRHGN